MNQTKRTKGRGSGGFSRYGTDFILKNNLVVCRGKKVLKMRVKSPREAVVMAALDLCETGVMPADVSYYRLSHSCDLQISSAS